MSEAALVNGTHDDRWAALGRVMNIFGNDVEPATGPLRQSDGLEWFAALPSLAEARWLVPLQGRGAETAALGAYRPWRWRGRVFKFVLARAMRYGWRGWARDRVGIPGGRLEPLRRMVRDSTGCEASVFSISLGADNRVGKVTIQAIDAAGRTLSFLKAGLTPAAEQRVRHETDVLRRLAAFPELSETVPAVLADGYWQGRYTLCQAPVGDRGGPEKFTYAHADFLERLQRAAPSRRSPGEIADEVEARWDRIARLAPATWRIVVSAALDRARRLMGSGLVPCGPAHGDFAPWNTRRSAGRLVVFDWELAQWEAPSGWDRLHFLVQWDSLVQTRWRPERILEQTCGDARAMGLALLYFVHSASRLAEEGIPWGGASMRYRKQALDLSVAGGKFAASHRFARASAVGWRRAG